MLSHEYEKLWSASGDYEPLVMPAGTKKLCFALPFMQACTLTKVVVQQTVGTPVGFNVNVYNRQVCEVLAGSSS